MHCDHYLNVKFTKQHGNRSFALLSLCQPVITPSKLDTRGNLQKPMNIQTCIGGNRAPEENPCSRRKNHKLYTNSTLYRSLVL